MDRNTFDIANILARKYRKETLSVAEEQMLESWRESNPRNGQLFAELMAKEDPLEMAWLEQIDEDQAWERIKQKGKFKGKKVWGWAVAASVAILLSFSLYFILNNKDHSAAQRFVESKDEKYNNDILPANLGAKIILASGKEIKVSDTLNVPEHGELVIADAQNGPQTSNTLLLNTLVVPAANFFKLTLGDGTLVWVNSNSRLQFPSQFSSKERRVYLSGEAYFEVAKDRGRPFFVETGSVKVRVLGTHFNVSAYNSNNVKTSLAEGAVEVSGNSGAVVIAPGQSAEWNSQNLRVGVANLQKDLAWKNNEFYFKGDNIVSIAHQLQVWYDLDITLSEDLSLTETYTGQIRRDVRLSEVLKMLELVSDLDFKLNENKLLIINKKAKTMK
ncbi:FecR family protein [Pedobacter africanus]|uniref:FecR family protein n=1 Tax=Pedobacter africanus TaxID=151894 RepID=A0A1W2B018_9SPHI|nr:FecR family protein [Pedobacter africanus]SMC66337.1 FecR family protein [Pedobacter africanus]